MSDQAARERAIHDHEHTILVEAGAGTGKTWLLVKRICAMIEHGVKPSSIAAVTFTVKAAGELKQRLRNELLKSQSSQTKEALAGLDQMTVNTIHGMAAEFLRTLPVEAKLPPDFVALDELQQLDELRRFRDEWLSRSFASNAPEALLLVETLGLDLLGSEKKGLRKLFDILATAQSDPERVSTGLSERKDAENVLAQAEAIIAILRSTLSSCHDSSDKLYVAILNYNAWLASKPTNIWNSASIWWLMSCPLAGKGIGTQTGWNKEALKQAKELHKSLHESIAAARNAIFSVACHEIVRWISAGVSEFRESLQTRGSVSFDDQLALCRDMLRRSKTARDFFKARFDYVHVDEFQDTDPVQVEMLFFLCERKEKHADDWTSVDLQPGKLFVVGDPKQSIYRFRGADVRIYNMVANRIEKEGTKLTITRNFRSRPGILSEVNAVISPFMQGRDEYEAKYVDLEPRDESADLAPAVDLLLPDESYNRQLLTADQAAAREAAAIAEHLALLAISNAGFDYSKVAILMRAGTKSAVLQEALSARGIPYVSFINAAYVSRVEIETLLTMLHALANPQNTMAVVGTLRSIWFSLSDVEITEYKLAGGSFVYTDPQERSGPVGDALDQLLAWHMRGKFMSTAALIEELLAARPLEILMGMKSEGLQRVQNIRTLIDIVRKLEQGGSGSLLSTVERIAAMNQLVQNTELDVQDDVRSAVQIMSLHKAKGLEFNVVYLFNYSDNKRKDGEWALRKSLDASPHVLGVSVSSCETSNWKQLKADDAAAQCAERNRLLYVGMTRARDKLVLPLGWSRKNRSKADPNNAEALLARYPLAGNELAVDLKHAVTCRHSRAEALPDFLPLVSQLKDGKDTNGVAAREFRAWRDALTKRVHTLAPPSKPRVEEESELDWSRIRARRIGTYVHAALEQLAKKQPQTAAQTLAHHAVPLADAELAEAQTIIDTVLRSSLFTEELPRARRILTELPVLESGDEHTASHYVDLVFEKDNGEWIIVDYKTDDISPDAVPSRANYHRDQLLRYARMFERVVGTTPSQCRVYFLRPNVMVTV